MSPKFKYCFSVGLIYLFVMAGVSNGYKFINEPSFWPGFFFLLDVWLCSHWHNNAMAALQQVREQQK